jgi:glycine betaine/proline transport system substrate-binding protein
MFVKKKTLVASVLAFGLVAAACGSDDSDSSSDTEAPAETDAPAETEAPAETDAPADTETGDDAADDSGDASGAMPGEGTSVTMGRADWSTGYFQAALYHDLLEELGYDVSDPAELEIGPSNFYTALAQGDADFWVNSWYPGHRSWLENELPDGSVVGDHTEIVGEEMMAGGLQGFLMTKSFAEEYGVTTMDQLNDDPEILAAFDATDPTPGNGIADVYGCQESWTCDDIFSSMIAFSEWENIEQVIAGYDAMMAEAVTKADAGEPMVIYTWTPSAYITNLIPGDNVVWLAVDEVLDDSNPLGLEGGEEYSQLPGQAGGMPPEQCPAAAESDTCQLGWIAADIQVTGNSEWLAANPSAAALLDAVVLSVIDVSLQNVAQDGGETPEDLAAQWLVDNRAQADEWLAAARAAG